MKTLLFTLVFFTVVNFSSAQIAGNLATSNLTDLMTTETDPTDDLSLFIAQRHTGAAKKQVSNYLAQELKYSEEMQQYGLEGVTRVEVVVNEKGEVIRVSILESPHSEIAKMVFETMQGMRAISIKNQDYRGLSRIEIPITFSLK